MNTIRPAALITALLLSPLVALAAPAPEPAWTFWEIERELTTGEHELAVRAWDSAGQTQPAAPDDTWNYKGYLSAAWHRVRVTVA